MTRCKAIHAGGEDRPILGTLNSQLHTVLANTEQFGEVGGHLSRLVWELLDPAAQVRRLETLFYTEAGLLGPLRTQDMKMIVASFATMFGTPDADLLRDFCVRHQVPLAWSLSSGETWEDEQIKKSTMKEWMPFSNDVDPVGGARILDPTSWRFTNANPFQVASKLWQEIEAE